MTASPTLLSLADRESLTGSESKVLRLLNDYYSTDECCLYSSYIASLTDLTVLQARRAIKSLERKGFAQLVRGLFDDDGKIAGSGYCCTAEGRARSALEASHG